MIKVAVAGVAGKMGKTILSLAFKDPDFQVTGGLEHPESPVVGKDLGTLASSEPLGNKISSYAQSVLKEADVLIDFTHPSATPAHVEAAVATKTALVIGTTGLNEKVLKTLVLASKSVPIVQSPNMSVGVNLLFRLAEITAVALGEGYDIEITEAHHRMKKDSPSGTAMKLLDIFAQIKSGDSKRDVVYGRQGETGARPRGQIGVFALRGGDVIGDHTVFFFGDGERVELTHRATSREAFAQGALRAAKFVVKQKRGLFNMQQVLGIS